MVCRESALLQLAHSPQQLVPVWAQATVDISLCVDVFSLGGHAYGW